MSWKRGKGEVKWQQEDAMTEETMTFEALVRTLKDGKRAKIQDYIDAGTHQAREDFHSSIAAARSHVSVNKIVAEGKRRSAEQVLLLSSMGADEGDVETFVYYWEQTFREFQTPPEPDNRAARRAQKSR
jgi:hypothetical protein